MMNLDIQFEYDAMYEAEDEYLQDFFENLISDADLEEYPMYDRFDYVGIEVTTMGNF